MTLVAASAAEAVVLSRRHRARIDLLLTDAMMPRSAGHDLAAQLREGLPTLRLLSMSGFSGRDSVAPPRGQPVVGRQSISKLFTAVALMAFVRRAVHAEISDA